MQLKRERTKNKAQPAAALGPGSGNRHVLDTLAGGPTCPQLHGFPLIALCVHDWAWAHEVQPTTHASTRCVDTRSHTHRQTCVNCFNGQTCTHAHVATCAHTVYARTHTHAHPNVATSAHTHAHTKAHTYVHMRTHKDVHTNTYVHTHTCTCENVNTHVSAQGLSSDAFPGGHPGILSRNMPEHVVNEPLHTYIRTQQLSR